MELLQLKYFQTVAKYQHITQAAETLKIAQPALSMTIARLEKELGIPLFSRKGRNIQLNEFGEAFLKHVNQIFMELECAKQELNIMAGIHDCQVYLATTSERFLSGLLTNFLSNCPRTKFRQSVIASPKEIQHLINEGEIDFFLTSPPIDDPRIESVVLLEDEILLGLPASHRYAGRNSIKLQEVAEDSFISLSKDYSFRELTDQLCRKAGFTPNIIFEGDARLTIELLRAGCGIRLTPRSTLKMYANASVVFLRIEDPPCQRTISLSWFKDKPYAQVAQSFRQFVIENFKTYMSN